MSEGRSVWATRLRRSSAALGQPSWRRGSRFYTPSGEIYPDYSYERPFSPGIRVNALRSRLGKTGWRFLRARLARAHSFIPAAVIARVIRASSGQAFTPRASDAII